MEKQSKWLEGISVTIAVLILSLLAGNDKGKDVKEAENNKIMGKRIEREIPSWSENVTIRGKVLEVHDAHGYVLLIESEADQSLCQVDVPESDETKKFKKGDIVNVTYSGTGLESIPEQLIGVTSVEIERPP